MTHIPYRLNPKHSYTANELLAWKKTADVALDAQISISNIRSNVAHRAELIDHILIQLWQQHGMPSDNLALIAVGGYGRGEILPYSDIDLLILSAFDLTHDEQQQVSSFVQALWDLNFDLGISVRSYAQCIEVIQDITIATSLIESRLIAGDAKLKKIPRRIVMQQWSNKAFYEAKLEEQRQRYIKHNYTEYNLEPDVKNAPGGLRDISQIGWIGKQHYRVSRFYDLVHLDFLTEHEFAQLQSAEDFLWCVRSHLHAITKRNENRLLFDYQHEVAARMGYTQSSKDHRNKAIEDFMRDYYRVAMHVSTLNEMLLAYFYENVIEPKLDTTSRPHITSLNEHFNLIGNKIAVVDHKLFNLHPKAILEIFTLVAKTPTILGIRAITMRLLMIAAHTIDQQFRDNPAHRQLFMEIFSAPDRLFFILKDMKRYGILGQYLPEFAQITGLMQYDLFHIYTVDAHTLVVIRNLQRFAKAKYVNDFPVASMVFNRLENKTLVYLAALFHDIAKGRGGDHSELGAVDAIQFCLNHGLSRREAGIVAWLTQNHLMMSLTAQKQDISDPDVIRDFARKVSDKTHLDYLYTLTVADINATNPNLWNSWKASLLRQLYTQTKRLLSLGLENPIDRQGLIDDNKTRAMYWISSELHTIAQTLWQDFNDDYFIKEQPSDIAWHTTLLCAHQSEQSLVSIRTQKIHELEACQLFIYTKDMPNLFAATVATLDQLNLNVLDARIIGSKKSYSLDTYVIEDKNKTLNNDPDTQRHVIDALQKALENPQEFPTLVQKRLPRELRHFNVPTQVEVEFDAAQQHHILELVTLDFPGLLARVGLVFMQCNVNILSARIATLGERAEDIFLITHQNGEPLTLDAISSLKQALISTFGQDAAQTITKPFSSYIEF